MKSTELLRKLNRMGAEVIPNRGKGGHVLVILNGRRTTIATNSRADIAKGTFHAILKQLGITREQLEDEDTDGE